MRTIQRLSVRALGGGSLGTLGGAAVGGVIGNQVAKDKK
jgi:outer membrane lipoprotein SlyB